MYSTKNDVETVYFKIWLIRLYCLMVINYFLKGTVLSLQDLSLQDLSLQDLLQSCSLVNTTVIFIALLNSFAKCIFIHCIAKCIAKFICYKELFENALILTNQWCDMFCTNIYQCKYKVAR